MEASHIRGRALRGIIVVMAICLLAFSACTKRNTESAAEPDILSQKTTEDGRTKISVLVKYAFSINKFEEAVEEKFPDIDIVQVGNYTGDSGVAEYERRLKHDDLTDIVMTWPLNVGEEYWKDRLLDLSGYDFAGRYKISELNKIARDGALYYLPGPAQVRGILYNKTLFKEKGWKVPDNFQEFLQLCRTIEETGIRSIQLGFKNSEVLDTAFVGYNYESCYSKPDDLQWIDEYNKGTGSFGDHFSSALDGFQTMIDAGVWKASDLDVDYAQREYMIFNRQCAMIEDSVLMARMGHDITGTEDEFALMPFFDSGIDSDWARLYMVCYIGADKHLAEEGNEEKLDLVMDVLDYISTSEGQEALSADTGAMFSSLNGVEPPYVEEIADLIPALSEGRYAIFTELKNAQGALREGLAAMLRGEADKEDVIRRVDEQNAGVHEQSTVEVLGKAAKDFSLIETGSFVTDAMRKWSGSDIALFLDNGKDGKYNGKGISARIYEGDVTTTDLNCVLPDVKRGETKSLWKVTMTGRDLLNVLENGLKIDNYEEGWFYYFSGLKVEFNPTAKPGERVESIAMSDGTKLDETKIYSVAVMDNTIEEKYIINCEKTDKMIFDILKETLEEQKTISPAEDGRFSVVQ